MKLGIITTAAASYSGDDFPEAMRRISEAGYDGVMYYQSRDFTLRNISTISKTLKDNRLRLMSVHSEWPVFFSGPPAHQTRALDEIASWFEIADRLEAENLVVHPCSEVAELPANQQEEAIERYCRGMKELALHHPHLPVAVENMIGGKANMYAATWEELTGLVTRMNLPNIGYCLDTGHAMTTGVRPGEMAQLMSDRLLTTHLHDNHGQRDEHLPPGQGIIDWAETLRAVETANPEASFVIEINLSDSVKEDQQTCIDVMTQYREFLQNPR